LRASEASVLDSYAKSNTLDSRRPNELTLMTGIGPSRLDKRSASFEASLHEAPQDEEICYAIDDIPHPEEAAKQLSRRMGNRQPLGSSAP